MQKQQRFFVGSGLILEILLVITLAGSDIFILASVGALIFFILGGILLGSLMAKKKLFAGKEIILSAEPNIARVLLQIEAMKELLVFCETEAESEYRKKYEVSFEDYIAHYSVHKDYLKHPCHLFKSQELETAFYRHELIDYYNTVILPSNLPKELKTEWKQAAIDSWIMMEE